ncbi:hypothetical protein ACWIE6_25805 [Paenibacillus taichungensis]
MDQLKNKPLKINGLFLGVEEEVEVGGVKGWDIVSSLTATRVA